MKTKHLVMTVLVAALTTFGTMFALNRYFPAGNDTAAQTGSPFQLADYKFPVAPDGMAPVDFTSCCCADHSCRGARKDPLSHRLLLQADKTSSDSFW